MVILEAALVLAVLGVLLYGTVMVLTRPRTGRRSAAAVAGSWRVAHFDVEGETRVVLQLVGDAGAELLDEHLVATVRADDPDYDEKFLTAMDTARRRQALFEVEGET